LDESICPHDAEIEAFFNKFLGRIWLVSLFVAFSVAAGGYFIGRASDCSPKEIDGQCGMSTYFGSLFGALAGAVIVAGMTLYVIIAAYKKRCKLSP
jgi:hypothetical protein